MADLETGVLSLCVGANQHDELDDEVEDPVADLGTGVSSLCVGANQLDSGNDDEVEFLLFLYLFSTLISSFWVCPD